MRCYRAFDEGLIVHLVRFKGELTPACAEIHEESTGIIVSPVWLPSETPVTCMRCIEWEARPNGE